MFAQLGNIMFENMLSPVNYGRTSSAVFAEHERINGKNRLQFTGEGLDELRIDMRLHVGFCNPRQTLDILKEHQRAGDVLKLISGTGIVEGDFVLLHIDEMIETADVNGVVFSYLVTADLKEYYSADRHDEKKRAALASARAVVKDLSFKMPELSAQPVPLPSPEKKLATGAGLMAVKARVVDSILAAKAGLINSSEIDTVKRVSNTIISTAQDVLNEAAGPFNVLNQITGGTNIVSDILSKATNVLSNVGMDAANTLDFSKQLTEATRRLQKATAGMINDVIKRDA